VWGEKKVHTGFWWGDLREGDHLGDPGVDARIILKWIFKKWDGAWTGLNWSLFISMSNVDPDLSGTVYIFDH
jgi:hypothetical protein